MNAVMIRVASATMCQNRQCRTFPQSSSPTGWKILTVKQWFHCMNLKPKFQTWYSSSFAMNKSKKTMSDFYLDSTTRARKKRKLSSTMGPMTATKSLMTYL